jgi:hypothetical protein
LSVQGCASKYHRFSHPSLSPMVLPIAVGLSPCQAQETPIGKTNTSHYVFFDNWVHVQTSLNKLGSKCAIFLEFRHWKPDKKKVRRKREQREGEARRTARLCGRCEAAPDLLELTRVSVCACACDVACAQRSTKAYCFLEMDEIRSGPVTLEVYKKPAIYNRKRNPSLLSVKPFYLHLELQVETVQD